MSTALLKTLLGEFQTHFCTSGAFISSFLSCLQIRKYYCTKVKYYVLMERVWAYFPFGCTES